MGPLLPYLGCMLDFDPLRAKSITMAALAQPLTVADLRALTTEMVVQFQTQLAACVDADVVFQPVDPNAVDERAASAAERNLAWTLAHVAAHTTASAEESAVLAAEMARGVPLHGRSRFETPWESLTSLDGCRQRLVESLRMRLASLDLWPDTPNLEIKASYDFLDGEVDARGRFLIGLWHDDGHLKQITGIVGQARAARGEAV